MPPPVPPNLSLNVLILAGGQSRRMGRDKALIRWQGSTFLERCARVALTVGDRCDIVTPWPQRYQSALPPDLLDKVHWCPDPIPGAGPPQAIAALLTLPPAIDFHWTLILACDMPNLDPQRLSTWRSHLATLSPETLVYIPRRDNYWEPLCGFYRTLAGTLLQSHLDGGGRSLQSWLSTLRSPTLQAISLTATDHLLLHNCNHVTDLPQNLQI